MSGKYKFQSSELKSQIVVSSNDPHVIFSELLKTAPVHYVEEDNTWIVCSFSYVMDVLRRPVFCADKDSFWGSLGPMDRSQSPSLDQSLENWLIYQEDIVHRRLRTYFNKALTKKLIDVNRSSIEETLKTLVSGVPKDIPFNVASHISKITPISAMAKVLGFSPAEASRLQEYSLPATALDTADSHKAVRSEPLIQAIENIRNLFTEVVERCSHANDDQTSAESHLIKQLLIAEEAKVLNRESLIDNLIMLVYTGHRTTESLLNNIMFRLSTNAEARKALFAKPTNKRLLTSAVEETLRLEPPIFSIVRRALTNVDFYGRKIKEGQKIVAVVGAANRDPKIFKNPNEFKLSRPAVSQHLGFGFGRHQCLGSHLAMTIATALLKSVFTQWSHFELARSDSETGWKALNGFRGVDSLHIIRK